MKSIISTLTLLMFSTFILSAQTVVNWAGTPETSGSTMSGVPKESAKFSFPYGITIDSKGNSFVTEEGNHTFDVIAANGATVIRAGGVAQPSFVDASGTTARFNAPRGMVVGPSDEIYVCDYENCVIRVVSKFGNFGSSQTVNVFSGKYSVQGSYLKASPGYTDGTAKTAQFDGPTDIDIDASGNLYVVDRNNHCIRKVATDGSVTTFAGTGNSPGSTDGSLSTAKFNTPTGIHIDGNDIYIADRMNSSIRKISGGQVTTVTNQLYLPNDVVKVGSDLFIADQCKIMKYSGGTISVYAGSPNTNDCAYKEGNGTNAKFKEIFNLMALSGGELLVVDRSNHCIRKILDCSGYKPTITKNGNTLTSETGKSYQWYKGGSSISGATSKAYTATVSGDYQCEVTNNDGCTSKSNTISVVINSIEENGLTDLNVYPNPAKDHLNIELTLNDGQNIKLHIINQMGQIVNTRSLNSVVSLSERIDISDLDNGIYYIQIQAESFSKILKFIKE